ncbi:hypothetical protein GOEFS_096_01000 [Gordonia effusa NBRC 100432]|uniref:ESAT-6-like protein n=1 Tax=Gordonia effusa NBRC 100432 TaxID=1077974 RepID=H0R4C2_9ACTN|nr:WXG100 family type VII secretion target [Gordonia effusa]GAB19923.1 hypothetical protein GOEFS_096_01000 [Gordonia effusa NBRC 100432]
MPTQGLNLDVSTGLASTKSVAGLVDEMQQVIRAIQTSSTEAVSMWKGRASSAFDTTSADWSSSATKLQLALDDIKVKLASSFTNYGDQDDQAAAGFSGGNLNI